MNEITFRLEGKKYRLSKKHVLDSLFLVAPKPTDKYFILIDGRPFPPKQVLATALSIPIVNFTTSAANAILRRLGFEIQTVGGVEIHSRTESERLFEIYLQTSGHLNFEFEPQMPGSATKPDFVLTWRDKTIVFDAKEFQATPDDLRLGGGSYDPYGAIRDKIQEGRKKFRELKQYPCALVLYNAGKPLVDLTWEFIYGAMLGNLGFSIPFDPVAGRLVERPVLSPGFGPGGEMHREKDGQPINAQNTTISAVLVLQLLSIGKRRFHIQLARHRRKLGRELTYEEYFRLVESSRGTDRDLSLRELRSVTCLNPYARIEFPKQVFTGPYDECYGPVKGQIQRVSAGEQLQKLELEEQADGVDPHGILVRSAPI